jgi:hypothetical protein
MFFCFVQNFFFGQHKLEYLFFLSRKARNFVPEFNIGLHDKNSESDYFFSSTKNQNIFFSNIGNQNIFLEKNHNTPFKLNGRSLNIFLSIYKFKMYSLHAGIISLDPSILSCIWKKKKKKKVHYKMKLSPFDRVRSHETFICGSECREMAGFCFISYKKGIRSMFLISIARMDVAGWMTP